MCKRAVEDEPDTLEFVPNHLKTQEMCNKAVEECPYMLEDVPFQFKTQKMCNAVVMGDSLLLRYVSDWFVTQQQVKLRDDRLIGWYEDYQKHMVQKARIKEELLSIAWHPSRCWDQCKSEDEKNRQKNCL